ncbi:LAME_0F17326g1_1 [Lachancea meyersii CBS 8951]|uniref:LAME_0F17326g1_1 n=1 Tax=Lachancea meyersii CBS 8951 TaxID=1266667 RepID=A0A1G4JZV1_9SACH|nr:LAME_0F17326g1_1 [Lachancea meyersii CBS 8951]
MHVILALSSVLAVATASPIAIISDLFKRKTSDFDPLMVWPGNLTQMSNWSNWTNPSNWHNASGVNSSGNSSYSGHPSAGWPSPKLQVFVTGGEYQMSNWTMSSDVQVTTLFNQSSLNATYLYSVASSVASSLESDEYTGVVVLGSEQSLESLGFFLSVVTDSPKSLVVTSELEDGLSVAWSDNSWWRGVLVVDGCSIYSGSLYNSGNPSAGNIGSVYAGEPWFWFTPAWPTFLSPESTLRQEYYNFTEIATANTTYSNSVTTIPIVYDGYYDPSLINSVSSSVKGLVVVSSGNSTSSELKSSTVPVVFASDGYEPVFPEDVPQGAIAGGTLSPVQAQLLLSIAVVNNATDPSSLQGLFLP